MTSITPTSQMRGTTLPRIRQLAFALPLLAIASFGCAKEETREVRLSRANEYFAAQQYDQAEKEYRDVLRLAPEDPAALRQLAFLYFEQGQARQAYSQLKRAAELKPDDTEVQLKLGQIFLALRDYAQAREAAVQVLDKQPESEPALLLLADASRTPDDIEDARKRVQSLRERDQDRPKFRLALGTLAVRQNDQAGAESEFKAALNLDLKSSDAYAALGTLYWSRNDLKEAGQALKTAADLAPPRSAVPLRFADFLVRTGATAEGKKILEDISAKRPAYLPPRVYLMRLACAEHPDNADCAARVQNILAQDALNFDALFQSVSLSLAKGEAEKAVRESEQLNSTYGQSPQARFQLAQSYLLSASSANPVKRKNLVDAAERNLNLAIQLDPHFAPAIMLLAGLKIGKGNPAAAVDLLAPLTKERPQIAQAQYLLATTYLLQQKRDDALAVYRQMMELFPKDPQPYLFAGSILLGQGKQQEARSAFEKAVEISPDYLLATEALVNMDIVAKQYAPAMDRVQKFIDKDPKLAQPWALRGKIYLAQRDFTHAEPDLLKAIELDPKLEPAYLLLTQLYVESNRQKEAIARLKTFVETNNDVPALMQLATLQMQEKDFDAARATYEKLLSIAPNFSLALNNLAGLYSERPGQLDKAYDLANKAREVSPKEPHIADTLGWILFKKGEYGNALQLLQESSGQLPDLPEIQFHLGMAYYMVGEEGPARLALQKAADASADFPGKDEARERLALLAIQVGAVNAGARTELENYLRKWPNDPAALARLAELQQQEGALDQAVKTYEKLISDDPHYVPATRQLALLYSKLSIDSDKVYELVTQARQAYPDDPGIAKTLGILSYRRGYYPQSLELLKEAAAKQKDDPEVLYYIGEVHRQLKQYTECKQTLDRALSLNLPPGLADDARRALSDCSDSAPL
jgi:tetratricopeptide (TPR) repeat protein